MPNIKSIPKQKETMYEALLRKNKLTNKKPKLNFDTVRKMKISNGLNKYGRMNHQVEKTDKSW